MYNLKRFIELQLLKIYNFSLEKNFQTFLFIIDLMLPKSNFKIRKKGKIQINSKPSHLKNLPNFAQEIVSVKYPMEKNKYKSLIFIVPDSNDSLTKFTILNLAKSLEYDDRINYLVITRFGEVISSNKKYSDTLSIDEIINTNPDIILFEIHTIYENFGLFNEQNFSTLKKLTKTKIVGVCFDIWRDFDLSYIDKWDGLVDKFIHMDQESVYKYGLNLNKMIFWPFVGWVNPIKPRLNKNKVIYFSGNLRPSDRRYILKFTKKISTKLKLQMHVNKIDHSQPNKSKSEDNYFDNLNQSQYVLGLAQKSKTTALVTFRSLEAIRLNCTLLQQEIEGISPLSIMFLPDEHYLPFNSLNDIARILKDISLGDSRCILVGKSGGDFMAKYYSPKLMWRYLFHKLD